MKSISHFMSTVVLVFSIILADGCSHKGRHSYITITNKSDYPLGVCDDHLGRDAFTGLVYYYNESRIIQPHCSDVGGLSVSRGHFEDYLYRPFDSLTVFLLKRWI